MRSDAMIKLSKVTVVSSSSSSSRVELATQQCSNCSNPTAAPTGPSTTTKELGGEPGPPRHELKPDNETWTRFHRHKAVRRWAS